MVRRNRIGSLGKLVWRNWSSIYERLIDFQLLFFVYCGGPGMQFKTILVLIDLSLLKRLSALPILVMSSHYQEFGNAKTDKSWAP